MLILCLRQTKHVNLTVIHLIYHLCGLVFFFFKEIFFFFEKGEKDLLPPPFFLARNMRKSFDF
jgi:hypothetical protein